jgi:hypothetical protein
MWDKAVAEAIAEEAAIEALEMERFLEDQMEAAAEELELSAMAEAIYDAGEYEAF